MKANYNEKNYYKNTNLGLKISYKLTGLLGPHSHISFKQ